jgi:hypothetical protein
VSLSADRVVELHEEAVRHAHTLAKAERTREIRGRSSVRRFNDQGLHPYSVEWGRIWALQELLPEMLAGSAVDPVSMRSEAGRAAERDWPGWE